MQAQRSKSEGGQGIEAGRSGRKVPEMALHFTKKHNWLLGHVGSFQRSLMKHFSEESFGGEEGEEFIYGSLSHPLLLSG